MSTAVNYYLSLARGKLKVGDVTANTSSQNTSADVEIRMQIDNGSTTTGLTREDVIQAMRTMEAYLLSNGIPGGSAGTNLPAK